MSSSQFARLSTYIREYVYRHNWMDLRQIQVQAIKAILDTDDHLLLTSGTASGKTEAAFLPILTLLEQKPAAGLGVLYIGPTKALINDQFTRLEGLLEAANLPVWSWHGDVSASSKKRLLDTPSGILQITPESLEGLLINRSDRLAALFCDLRFVVIDEVHAFMGSDRGQQILCQLARLSRYSEAEPRRVGLSATLGDTRLAKQWLASGSKRAALAPAVSVSGQRIRLSLEHFERPEENVLPQHKDPYYLYLFEQTKNRKCLIFANRRSETEDVVAALRHIAAVSGQPDIYHVHHGSIAPALREAAEQAMRASHTPAVTAATITLELGIDLGQLESSVQLDAPHSVMSFVQRLGRSGRRGEPQTMRLVSTEKQSTDMTQIPLPWQLLQSCAIVELYLREQWIEPVQAPRYPFSLLYHQTMSTLLAAVELSPAQLAAQVLSLPPFKDICPDDYRILLRHLLTIDHLQQIDDGGLIIGLAGEQIARDWRFFAVFQDSKEFTVYDNTREIGSIGSEPAIDELIGLAGATWQVLAVDSHQLRIFVKAVPGRASGSWSGETANVQQPILQKMRSLLVDPLADYRYLRPQAKERLAAAHKWAAQHKLHNKLVIPWGCDTFCLLPWMGSKGFRKLERLLRYQGRDTLGISRITSFSPYYLIVQSEQAGAKELEGWLNRFDYDAPADERLLGSHEAPRLHKYDEFIPESLLRKAFLHDQLGG